MGRVPGCSSTAIVNLTTWTALDQCTLRACNRKNKSHLTVTEFNTCRSIQGVPLSCGFFSLPGWRRCEFSLMSKFALFSVYVFFSHGCGIIEFFIVLACKSNGR